jgi:hypothetical protein
MTYRYPKIRLISGVLISINTLAITEIFGEPTYLSGDLPQLEKIRRLKPFFQPPLGDKIKVDPRELRDFDHEKSTVNPLNLRGFIKVSPPKKYCFTITRHQDLPDDYLCKPKILSFTLNDLQKDGGIQWTIKTGPLDFGTVVEWKTPYRLASVMPENIEKDAIVHKLIESCQAKKNTVLGNQIIIRFFGGEEWLIDFPEEDELLPQPMSTPNLYLAVAPKKGIPNSKKGASTETKASETKEKPTAPTATNTETSNAKGKQTTSHNSDDPIESEFDDREIWAIPKRSGFRMDGYRFMPRGPTTKWSKGECRYVYSGPPEDPETGRLECHDVDGFKEVYMPLICLKEFRP